MSRLPSEPTVCRGLFRNLISIALLASLGPVSLHAEQPARNLLGAQSLELWEVLPREAQLWQINEGLIAGGSLTENVPHNSFLATKGSYQNFDLRLQIRLSGTEGFINSGIQVRSIRVPGSHEMEGYQVDVGKGWWGKLYDESRRRKVIAEPSDPAAVARAVREGDWNEFRILAEGPRIRSWINGVPTFDYTEADPQVPLDGRIGIQIHGGGQARVEVKEISIRELPATPGAPTWQASRRAPAGAGSPAKMRRVVPPRAVHDKVRVQLAAEAPILSAQEELAGFQVPEGFEVELVAAEAEGIGKFIAVAFDARGRMWTMTALEYPVDANENAEASRQLFARGGRDKVLVFDQPYGPGPAPPRVFADGLAMPLGILPHRDGVYVQYGPDIRFYRDTNGDGKSDAHEVILTGFGTQDSHLFPHQFTRVPGGWILTAQGLFNYSTVRRPDGQPFEYGAAEVAFNQCKLARFAHDGSEFEALTAGPNNIWGLTISREGETWLQEANDLGYPIIPYEPGGHYQTGSKDRLRPYQPQMPAPLAPPQMGGTGLSGLALADDRDGWPAPWGLAGAQPGDPRMFYVANPIIGRIQVIQAMPENGRYRYAKGPDFLTSADTRFRPVAIQFGPDGCLYVTDWYNKIISHNEVPRNHPERDKLRGRIWRIRHTSQPRMVPLDLTTLSAQELLAQLGAPNARIADLAWQEIIDRGATQLVPELARRCADAGAPIDQRLGALWAHEGLATVPRPLLVQLAGDPSPNLRREAVRIAAAQPRPEDDFLAVAEPRVDDPHYRVRAALGDALRRVPVSSPRGIALMLQLGGAELPGNSWEAYDRRFERYLARWAMEGHGEAVAQFLGSPEGKAFPLENRILAVQALSGRAAAVGLATMVPELNRALSEEELRTLAGQIDEPLVAEALEQALNLASSRRPTLRSLLALRTGIDLSGLRPAVTRAAESLWQEDGSTAGRELALELAGAFKLQRLEPQIAELARAEGTAPRLKLAGLRALREMGVSRADPLVQLVTAADVDRPVRIAALEALAESTDPEVLRATVKLLPGLDYRDRPAVLGRMASRREGSLALLEAVAAGDLEPDLIPVAALDQMRLLLPGRADLEQLWRSVEGRAQHLLRLDGGPHDFVQDPVTLRGPFTVEAWVRLDPGITHADGILGRPGVLDLNFHDARFRVWVAQKKLDIVVARGQITPDTWRHFAVTRDAAGVFRLYVNGELDAQSEPAVRDDFPGLQIGRTSPAAGTQGQIAEFRIWNVARSAEDLRDTFDRSFVGDTLPAGLVHYRAGKEWGRLSGGARVEPTLDGPALLTAAEAHAQLAKFAQYRALAQQPGDGERGRALFTTHCATCHALAAAGGNIGPALDGVGLNGVEALLRNTLTPSAAMEGGYRNFQVLTSDGRIVQGLLVSEDAEALVLRQPNTADQRVPRTLVERAGFTASSVMPTGLLEALPPEQVRDLFTFLLSQKQGQP